jgi:hypothetical protein
MRIRMGSPGSAQVTRVRLLEQWTNLQVRTERSILHLRLLPMPRKASQSAGRRRKRRAVAGRRRRR